MEVIGSAIVIVIVGALLWFGWQFAPYILFGLLAIVVLAVFGFIISCIKDVITDKEVRKAMWKEMTKPPQQAPYKKWTEEDKKRWARYERYFIGGTILVLSAGITLIVVSGLMT